MKRALILLAALGLALVYAPAALAVGDGPWDCLLGNDCGGGNMSKLVYDTDDNGIADVAQASDFNGDGLLDVYWNGFLWVCFDLSNDGCDLDDGIAFQAGSPGSISIFSPLILYAPINYKMPSQLQTSGSYTPSDLTGSGVFFHNTGATAVTSMSLPSCNAANVGWHVQALQTVTTTCPCPPATDYSMYIHPYSGDIIEGWGTTLSADDRLVSITADSYVRMTCLGAGSWRIIGSYGTWANGGP